MKKIISLVLAGAVIGVIFSAIFFKQEKPVVNVGSISSSQTFSSSKIASKGLNAATTTPFSLYNNSTYDWGIKNIRVIGAGTGSSYYSSSTISSLYMRCNTSSDPYLLNASGVYALTSEMNTTTGEQLVSTTSPTSLDTGVNFDQNKWTITSGSYFNCRLFGMDATMAVMSMNATTSATSTGIIEVEYFIKN